MPILGLDPGWHALATRLMRRYADLPMDFADALRIERVFTTDRRGFRRYRGSRGTSFELVPR